ncbi:uncharacterized protein LOC144623580 [Crassostrea virginica]
MKAKISVICGSNIGDHIKRTMKKCMRNCLMAKMNLQGKKGKYSFANTNVCRLIKDSIIQIWPDCTEAKFLDEISRFLKYAPGRIGGGGRGRDVILICRITIQKKKEQSLLMYIFQ